MRARVVVIITAIAVTLGIVGAPAATADVPLNGATVTVVTAGGAPVPHEFVELWTVVEDQLSTFVTSLATDDAGMVQFPALAPGRYRANAWRGGTGLHFSAEVEIADAPAAATITEAGFYAVSGTVRDALTHSPVRSAQVAFHGPVSSDVASTDVDGRYTLVVSAGRNDVEMMDQLYLAAPRRDVQVNRDMVVDGSLYALSTVSGRITLGGAGFAGTVNRNGAAVATASSSGAYSTTVDAGTSVLSVPSDGKRYFTTYAGNTVRKPDARKTSVPLGRSVAHVDIALVRSATISGTVVDRKGKPARHVTIEAVNLGRTGTAQATTDSKGRYTLRGLASGKVLLYVSGGTQALPAYGQRTVTATQGKTLTGAKVTLSSDAVVYGKIKTTGSKVTRQDVSLKDSHGEYYGTFRPDAQGWVGFAALPAGTYYVHVDGSNVRKKVTVKAHRQVSFGTITRGRQVTVKGVVRTAAGKPAKSALVSVADSHGMVYATVRTNSHGVYSAKAVSGKYTVTAIARSGTDAPARMSLTVKKGKSAKKNLRLARGATIRGKVLNSHGRPAIGVRVETPDGRHATTSTAGTYTITGARAGRTTLIVWDPSYVGGYRSTTTTATAKAGKTVTARTVSVH